MWSVLAVAAAVRAAALVLLEPAKLHGDEGFYVRAAGLIAAGDGFPGSGRPPGLPGFLALLFTLVHPSLTAARIAQAVLSCVAVALVFSLVRSRHGVRAATLSALVVALHPTLAHYATLFWTETLFVTVLLFAVWSLDRFDRSGRGVWLVAAGAALGFGTLVREVLVYAVPVVAAWAAWRRAEEAREAGPESDVCRAAARAVLVLLPAALVVLPWTARNWMQHGRFVLVSTTRWMPVALGNILPQEGQSLLDTTVDNWFLPAYRASGGELEREEFARRVALDAIRAEQPWWIVKKLARNGYYVYSPDDQLARYVRRGWLDGRARDVARALVPVDQGYYVVTTALGLAAVWLVRGTPTKPIVVFLLLFHLVLYTFANANHRFRVPLLPLLALDVGPLLCGHLAAGGRRVRFAGAIVFIAGFAAIVATFYSRLGHPPALTVLD